MSAAVRVAAAAPLLVAIATWTTARNVFEPAKLALLLVLTAVWAILSGWDSLRSGVSRLQASPWTAGVLGFALAVLLATLTSDNIVASLMGVPARHGGALAYLAAAVLGVGIAGGATAEVGRFFIRASLVGLSLLGLYGALQLIGPEPLGAEADVEGVFVTLSNPNFAGGFAGALLGLAVWQVAVGPSRWHRALGVSGTVSALVIVLGAGSLSGYVSAAASLTVMLAGWLWFQERRSAKIALLALAGVVVAGAGVLVLGVFERGPLASIGAEGGVVQRRFLWMAALRMAGDNPLTGVGFDRYLFAHRAYRSEAAADAVTLSLDSDAAHSAPLQLISGGGFPMLIAYLALVVLTGWALFRVLGPGGTHHSVGLAIGSVWVGLLAQSIGSFDLPAHITLSMVSAGLLAGLAWPDRAREVVLPGRLGGKAGPKRGRRRRKRQDPVVQAVFIGLAVIFVALVAFIGTRPVAAEVAAGRAVVLDSLEEYQAAAINWQIAADRAPWEVDYPYRQGLSLLRADDPQAADPVLRRALEIEPTHFASLVSAARLALGTGDPERARDLYEQALAVDPHHVDLKAEVAQALAPTAPELARGVAADLRDRAPDHPSLAAIEELLGDA